MSTKQQIQTSKLNPLLNWVLAPFEDKTGLDRPEWWDVSRYQGDVNMMVLKNNGVQGVTARSTISWGYEDPMFQVNRKNALNAELFFNSYHVIFPGENVLKQVDNWYRAHDIADGVARTIDLELSHGYTWRRIADATWDMCEIVKSRDGFFPMIYSRKQLIDTWLSSWTTEMLNKIFYHLAQYLYDRVREHPGPPDLPLRVDKSRAVFQQTADKKAGYQGGVQSSSVDHNRFLLGSVSDLHQLVKQEWGGEIGGGIPEPPSSGLEFPLPEIPVGEGGVIDIRLNRDAINQIAEKVEM